MSGLDSRDLAEFASSTSSTSSTSPFARPSSPFARPSSPFARPSSPTARLTVPGDLIEKSDQCPDQTVHLDPTTRFDPQSYVVNLTTVRNSPDLRQAVERHYHNRRRAFRALNCLGSKGNGDFDYPNLDFLSYFGNYFYSDVPELCQVTKDSWPIRVVQVFGRGKVGIAEKITIGSSPESYIRKGIENVNQRKYLSLNFIENEAKSSQACPSLVYHQVNAEHTERTTGGWVRSASQIEKEMTGFLAASGDSFTIQTCLHLILNEILGDLPNYVYQYDAFYCQKKDGKISGYNLMEIAEYGDLSSYLEKDEVVINDQFLFDLMRQILIPLAILKSQKFGFCHSDLKCRNVFVARDPNGRPIYKLADFDKSSIFWRGIRFFNQSSLVPSTSWGPYPSEPNSDGEPVYSLGAIFSRLGLGAVDKLKVQAQTMHSPFPFFMSYDLYTMVLSLLREPKVWDFLSQQQGNSRFFQIVQSIFDSQDWVRVIDSCQQNFDHIRSLTTEIELKRDSFSRQFGADLSPDQLAQITALISGEPDEYQAGLGQIAGWEFYQRWTVDGGSNLLKTRLGDRRQLWIKLQTSLTEARALGEIIISLMPFKLKANLDDFYQQFGVLSPTEINQLIGPSGLPRKFKLAVDHRTGTASSVIGSMKSSSWHICTGPCQEKTGYFLCRTNRYSTTSTSGDKKIKDEGQC